MSFVLPAFPAEIPIVARFRLRARCHNCYRLASTVLPVPEAEGAPIDTDELLESSYLSRLEFKCEKCEGAICTLIAASSWQEGDDDLSEEGDADADD